MAQFNMSPEHQRHRAAAATSSCPGRHLMGECQEESHWSLFPSVSWVQVEQRKRVEGMGTVEEDLQVKRHRGTVAVGQWGK